MFVQYYFLDKLTFALHGSDRKSKNLSRGFFSHLHGNYKQNVEDEWDLHTSECNSTGYKFVVLRWYRQSYINYIYQKILKLYN